MMYIFVTLFIFIPAYAFYILEWYHEKKQKQKDNE